MPGSGEDLSGSAFGVIEKTLGRGGSATVYLARRSAHDAPVALKVLDAEHRSAPEQERLHREFDFARQLDHPNIITMLERGPHWLAMSYIDAGDASTLPTPQSRLAVLAQIASALDYAHQMGIVHCDVKPTNILVRKELSSGVLIDFGVAHSVAEDIAARLARHSHLRLSLDPAKRITHQHADRPADPHASLPYAPPEILLGRLPSAASDEYALACTTVELLTGTTPFNATTPAALIDAHLSQSPPRVSRRVSFLPRVFDSILARAMAKDPDQRYESCTEFVELITRAVR